MFLPKKALLHMFNKKSRVLKIAQQILKKLESNMANVILEKSKDYADLPFIKEMSAAGWPQFQSVEWLFNQTENLESAFVAILDSVKGRLTEPRIFKASKEVGRVSSLASALDHHRVGIATRIVVLVHDTHNADSCVLETLCS